MSAQVAIGMGFLLLGSGVFTLCAGTVWLGFLYLQKRWVPTMEMRREIERLDCELEYLKDRADFEDSLARHTVPGIGDQRHTHRAE